MSEDALVHRLPDELLVKVFKGTRDDSDRSGAWRGIVKQTHVCRRWRDVSLASPTLWTKVELGSMPTPAADVFLSRTTTAPLHVSVDSAIYNGITLRSASVEQRTLDQAHLTRTRESIINMLYRVAQHITYLELRHVITPPGDPAFTTLFSRSFPALETLNLVEAQGLRINWPKLDAPLLKNITLSAAGLKGLWDVDVLSRIVSLELEYIHRPTRLPLPDLVAMLSNCPRLERLVLGPDFADRLQGKAIPPVLPHSQIKQLGFLKRLEIKDGELIQTINFLDRLSCPVLERLLVGITAQWKLLRLTEQAWKVLLSSERTPFGTLIRRSRSLSFSMHDWYLCVADHPMSHPNYQLSIRTEWKWSRPSQLVASTINACLAEITGDTQIETLHLSLPGSVSCGPLIRDIFASTPSLVTLHIYNPSSVHYGNPELAQVVFNILCAIPEAEDEPTSLPLSCLQHIILDLSFVGQIETIDAPLNALVTALDGRKGRGALLQSLTVRISLWPLAAEPDSDGFVARLRPLANKVNWSTTRLVESNLSTGFFGGGSLLS